MTCNWLDFYNMNQQLAVLSLNIITKAMLPKIEAMFERRESKRFSKNVSLCNKLSNRHTDLIKMATI